MSVKFILSFTPFLYYKSGVCKGVLIFLIFDPKHRLWVLAINVLRNHIKTYQILFVDFLIVSADKDALYCMANFVMETSKSFFKSHGRVVFSI